MTKRAPGEVVASSSDGTIVVRKYPDGSVRLTANLGHKLAVGGMWMTKGVGGSVVLTNAEATPDFTEDETHKGLFRR